ncbi:hypothetical protein OPT61_g4066 [Boeremia exigua]|uniref:Uncharacterized protein n=1 Tax=Boeremia exigua TaxID=749465 RepID=A0ACC2IFG5_9PLEO|nr:hypothetical protein OPT61_g4066 [Boeremia exigua]
MVAASIWTFLLASTASVCAQNGAFELPCGNNVKRTNVVARDWHVERRNSYHSRRADNMTSLLPIDVYMHVISSDGTEEGGNMNDALLGTQMDILNERFQPVGFKFNLLETNRVINEEWYYNLKVASRYETSVSLALRKGDIATLNIYVMGATNTTTHAWASYPASQAVWDGVFINNTVMFGGSDSVYTSGITLIHEVGHWFGLEHTFANGCDRDYDFVADTPREDQPWVLGVCDETQDSCPDHPGLDSVHNYMAYTSDECRTEFTPGQIRRMREQMTKFRGVAYPGIIVEDIPEDSYDTPR